MVKSQTLDDGEIVELSYTENVEIEEHGEMCVLALCYKVLLSTVSITIDTGWCLHTTLQSD